MALEYAWFDSYDSVGYVLTLHISPHTVCPYLPMMNTWFQIFFCVTEYYSRSELHVRSHANAWPTV